MDKVAIRVRTEAGGKKSGGGAPLQEGAVYGKECGQGEEGGSVGQGKRGI